MTAGMFLTTRPFGNLHIRNIVCRLADAGVTVGEAGDTPWLPDGVFLTMMDK